MSQNNCTFLSSQGSISLAIFTSAQILIGTTANLCEIIYFLVLCHNKRATPSDKLTLNLAITDFIGLTTYLPWRTYLIYLRKSTKDYRIYASLYVLCVFATGNAIVSIAFDRLTAVVWPLRYKTLMTSRISSTFIATSWMSAILFGILHGFSYLVGIDTHNNYELFLCAVAFIQLAVMVSIYAVLLRTSRKLTRNILHLKREIQQKCSFLRRSVFTTLTIVCLFYITFLPYCSYRIYSTINKNLSKCEKHAHWRWLSAFTFVNSVFNPFVYFFGIERHRIKFTKYVRARLNRHRNENYVENRNNGVTAV